jgi:hypothetical protein
MKRILVFIAFFVLLTVGCSTAETEAPSTVATTSKDVLVFRSPT